jgi:hypothetical protein
MLHDIDRSDAYFAHEDAYLPPPNVIALNPENGHGHSAILLATPVARHSASRLAPLRFFADVERGFARRLRADRRYTGLIAKNPLHADWRVEWRAARSPTPSPNLPTGSSSVISHPTIDMLDTFVGQPTTFAVKPTIVLFDGSWYTDDAPNLRLAAQVCHQ